MADTTPTPPDPPAFPAAATPDGEESDLPTLARRVADLESALEHGLTTRSIRVVGDDGRVRVELAAADTYAALRLIAVDGETAAGDVELFMVDAMDGEPASGGCVFRGLTVSVWPH